MAAERFTLTLEGHGAGSGFEGERVLVALERAQGGGQLKDMPCACPATERSFPERRHLRVQAMQIISSLPSITSAAAFVAVQAAVAHGRSIGKFVVAAVVDVGGDLMAFVRADGAYSASIGIAQDKAYTASVFGAATDALSQALSANPALHQGISLRAGVVLFAGGLPIVADGKIIGGIGVSGGSEEDDRACARGGLAALGLDEINGTGGANSDCGKLAARKIEGDGK